MNNPTKHPVLEPLIRIITQRTQGIIAWIEHADDQPSAFMESVINDIEKGGKSVNPRAMFIRRMSVAPFLFYRFRNMNRLWSITVEDFNSFGVIDGWYQDSPYPKPGEVRRWLETL